MNRAERIAHFLEQRPNVWISALRFESIGGRLSWRTAISEARVGIIEPAGGKIEWRGRKVNGTILSEYKYVPAVREPQQLTLHEATKDEEFCARTH